MNETLAFGCACGAVRGELTRDCAKAGTRVVCHCADCRAFQVACGRDDPGAAVGADILQIAPAGMRFTSGEAHVAAMRLSPRGLLRWHATCCGTPLAATMPSRVVPFAGLLVDTIDRPEVLGPVRTHGFMKRADRSFGHKNVGRLVRGLLSRTVAAYLRGEARTTPFRAADGVPLSRPVLIDKARRAEIYKALQG